MKYAVLAIFLFAHFIAECQIDTSSVFHLEEVIITSQRNPNEPFSIPGTVNSISRKELDQAVSRTTPEALMNISGVFVQKTNHGGGSPFIRGLTGNQTLHLIDGIRLNNSIYRYGPNQYLNTIDQFTIRKIEVAKGTGSVQYGTDAIGGVLQVFTKDPLTNENGTAIHGQVLGRTMTGGMEKSTRGEVEVSTPKFGAIAGATYRDFGDLIGGKNTGTQSPSGYSEHAFDTKIAFELKKNITLTLANQILIQAHVPVYHKILLENYSINEFEQQQHMISYARLNIQGSRKLFNQIKVITSQQNNTEGRKSQKNGNNLLIKEEDRVNTLGVTAEIFSVLSNMWSANTGVELYHDNVGSKRSEINTLISGSLVGKRGLYPDNSKYGNYSIYSLHHFDLKRWIIDGGLRLSYFRLNISDITLGNVEISPAAFVFNSAVMYKLSRNNHLYVSVSSGFRAPNIDDMGSLGIVDFRYEIPSYDLKPEKSLNYEVGYKFAQKKFSGTLAVYSMDLNKMITRVKVEGEMKDGYQVYKKENIEKAYINGFEVAIGWEASKRFAISSGISYTFGQSITKNEPLRRIPPLNGRIAGTYTLKKFYSSAEFLFATTQDRLAQADISDNRIGADGTPGWNIFNFYAGYQFSPFKINIGLQNLFNEDYRTHGSGINGVGRSAVVTLNYLF
jgi:hemoglobin/transferrin/lactoferrin receptor protein